MSNQSLKDSSLKLTKSQLALMIEHTLLSDNLDENRIKDHVLEAIELDVFGVCLPLSWVPLAKKLLLGSNKKVVTVIDFPLGKKNGSSKS